MTILLLQHYIADIAVGSDKVSDGIESTGIPQGIPPLAEFLADYGSSDLFFFPILIFSGV